MVDKLECQKQPAQFSFAINRLDTYFCCCFYKQHCNTMLMSVNRWLESLPLPAVLRTLKTHLVRTQSLKVLRLKPGAGPYMAKHATPTARDFFLANFYPSDPFTCIFVSRSWELWMQKLKSHLLRTQSLKVLPVKPGVCQHIAIHATPTARVSSLQISTLPVYSPAFFKNLSRDFSALAVANTGSFVFPQNKTGHPAGCRFPCG